MTTRNKSTLRMAQLGILIALVIVLQSIASYGVINICLCLIPITLGAMLLGWKSGLTLGLSFGVIAFFWGLVGKDQFTYFLIQANPFMTAMICVIKGAAAGVVPALLYKCLSCVKSLGKFSGLVASIVASISAPIANTGLFALGCLIIKEDVIGVAGMLGAVAENFITLLFVVLIGANFFVELVVNAVFSPILNKLVNVLQKHIA